MNQTAGPLVNSSADSINRNQLVYMAYTGQFESVHTIMFNLPLETRLYYSDKNILSQAIWGSIVKLHKYRGIHNYNAVRSEQEFLTGLLNQFINYSITINSYPKELFQTILYVSNELIQLSLLDDAIKYLRQAIELGINKFPELRVDTINKIALIENNKGRIEDSTNRLIDLAEHPYLITDRNQIPEIFFRLSRSALKMGDIDYYKKVLFLGIRYFYTNTESRRKFIHQLKETYRSSLKLILDRRVNPGDKLIYVLHKLYFIMPNFHKIKLGSINITADKLLLAIMYLFNYIRTEPVRLRRAENTTHFPVLYKTNSGSIDSTLRNIERKKKILITRAMGGIGDLLMMTPGIHALKRKFPDKEIHLAIPKRYFPVFKHNEDIKLIDIEEEFFSHFCFSRWFDFTDCPAVRSESRKAPKIKKNRIDIFASALGIKGLSLIRMERKPLYFISEEEKIFAEKFFSGLKVNNKPIIGIQLHADETYRDFPLMENLVENLCKDFTVVLFDSNKINGLQYKNIIKVDSFELRQAFAIASKCNLIISPDSSFVHLAAALQIPNIALFGPIDGKVRTGDYPDCTYIDVREQLGCLPCWRNESIPCKLTGMRNSACMESIPVKKIITEIEKKLKECNNEKSK
jgi:ADP-heptose:LPS heptosyltransferase